MPLFQRWRALCTPAGALRAAFVLVLCLAAAACGSSPSSPSTTAAALAGVSLSATSAAGGSVVTATVTLSAAAPAAGAVITLSSSDTSLATVPASITIASGSASGTFDVTTATTSVTGVATITATYGSDTRSVPVIVGRVALQSFTLSSATIVGGGSVVGTVTASAPAPDSGLDVTLVSSSAVAIVPARITIPGGASSQDFTIATRDTASPVVATITATLSFTGSSRSATLAITRLALQQLFLGVTSVPGGLPLTGTIILSAPAPGDLVVALSSSNSAATVPANVTIPAGTTSQPFTINTVNTPPTRTVTITARYGAFAQSAALTVIAYATIPSLSCDTTTPKPGASITCRGTLDTPAPPGGWQFAFASSDNNLAGVVPDQLVVPAGSSAFSFQVVTAPVTTSMPVIIRILDAPSGLVLFSQAFTITP